MGSGVSKDTEAAGAQNETGSQSMSKYPRIIITAASNDDLFGPPSDKPLIIREARPGTPIYVGRRPFPSSKAKSH
ncbi:hypothetical protein COCON_G00215000 [Conger conger]|uniref:Uncharacterized protein n=1 Tax=Conger conger TaxID=82655 RepID=A0A9Q1CXN5_CONCO|nr:hypothetical protein COCON_G00215000 [Conger conger]